jgi:hypothetical protein
MKQFINAMKTLKNLCDNWNWDYNRKVREIFSRDELNEFGYNDEFLNKIYGEESIQFVSASERDYGDLDTPETNLYQINKRKEKEQEEINNVLNKLRNIKSDHASDRFSKIEPYEKGEREKTNWSTPGGIRDPNKIDYEREKFKRSTPEGLLDPKKIDLDEVWRRIKLKESAKESDDVTFKLSNQTEKQKYDKKKQFISITERVLAQFSYEFVETDSPHFIYCYNDREINAYYTEIFISIQDLKKIRLTGFIIKTGTIVGSGHYKDGKHRGMLVSKEDYREKTVFCDSKSYGRELYKMAELLEDTFVKHYSKVEKEKVQ